ncbi:MAG: hypothetical protein KAT65_22240 [Methanophagales archaeon]|nr:hypothetical protein [Methanophagales archaeon]
MSIIRFDFEIIFEIINATASNSGHTARFAPPKFTYGELRMSARRQATFCLAGFK